MSLSCTFDSWIGLGVHNNRIRWDHFLTLQARYSLEDSDERLDMGIPAPAHQHLEHLNLTGVISNRRLRFVLSHTPALRTLHLDGELEWLHDATFTSILETNPLPDLEVKHQLLRVVGYWVFWWWGSYGDVDNCSLLIVFPIFSTTSDLCCHLSSYECIYFMTRLLPCIMYRLWENSAEKGRIYWQELLIGNLETKLDCKI